MSDGSDMKARGDGTKMRPFLRALTALWEVAKYGARKYAPGNEFNATVADMWRYDEALWRHWMARRLGERLDPESGLPHLAHLAWTVLFMLEMELRGITNPEWKKERT